MTLTAYCVNIKHAADASEDGILRTLLAKAETGEADDAVWNFPCVRAVIDFKWTHWASGYLLIEFLLYLGWLLCFVGFMTLYIEKNLEKEFQHMDKGDKTLALLAYALDAGSLLFMCPFLVIEYNAIKHYKWHWLCAWNILHSLAFVLQLLISVLHFLDLAFTSKFYVSILSLHCTILFVKLQYFGRVMGPKATYVETLKNLLYNVRYFLLFIALSMISAALSFAVLYKWEIDRKEHDADFDEENFESFDSVPRAVVTAYSMLIGHFESAYIFHTENRFMKGTFLLFFQLFLSIAFLNLLVAVMTESYKSAMSKQNIIYYRCKAQIVDEIELSLPKMFYPKFKPYVHYMVCEERNKRKPEELSTPASLSALKNFENDVKKELKVLRDIVERLEQKVDQYLRRNE